MIKIQKDGHFVVCSNASYNTMYKRLGYTIVNENQKAKQVEITVNKPNEKIVEIPVIETKIEKDTKPKNNKSKNKGE